MARLTRQDWINAALDRLEFGTAEEATIVRLAASLGVSRGSFYHHFAGLEDYLSELEPVRVALLRDFEAEADAEPDDLERLRIYTVACLSSRLYMNLEVLFERNRTELTEFHKIAWQTDEDALLWQLGMMRRMGFNQDDGARYLSVMKAAAFGMVQTMMIWNTVPPLEDRIAFANSIADIGIAAARCS